MDFQFFLLSRAAAGDEGIRIIRSGAGFDQRQDREISSPLCKHPDCFLHGTLRFLAEKQNITGHIRIGIFAEGFPRKPDRP